MVSRVRKQLKFHSRPYKRRIGLIPMSIGLALGWGIQLLAIFLVVVSLKYSSPLLGTWRFGLVMALGLLLTYLTFKWTNESLLQFDLTLTDEFIELHIFDSVRKTFQVQQIAIADLSSAQYYTAQDSSSLYLVTPGANMDIPLWSFGPEAEKQIVEFIKSKDVHLIRVP